VKPGDLVILKSEEEIVWDDLMFEWDHTLLFSTRDHARDMSDVDGAFYIEPGVMGTVLNCDPNFFRVLLPEGIGWSRVHYWRVIT
jgi:hypothetical protein